MRPRKEFQEVLDRNSPVSGTLGQDADHGQQIFDPMRKLRRQDLLAFLRLLAIVDIGRAAEPGGDAALTIADGRRARKEPAVLAVVPTVAHLDLVLGALAERVRPLLDTTFAVVGMEHELRPARRSARA